MVLASAPGPAPATSAMLKGAKTKAIRILGNPDMNAGWSGVEQKTLCRKKDILNGRKYSIEPSHNRQVPV